MFDRVFGAQEGLPMPDRCGKQTVSIPGKRLKELLRERINEYKRQTEASNNVLPAEPPGASSATELAKIAVDQHVVRYAKALEVLIEFIHDEVHYFFTFEEVVNLVMHGALPR